MKIALLGTGLIVHQALLALNEVPRIEKTAIFARPHSEETARELAGQYGIPEVYTDYDRLLQETGADTVYVGLVNSAHFSFAKKALLAGKHVIMEKPFTSTAAEACEILKIAEENDRMAVEAVVCIHSSIMDKMKEVLPQLGTIRMVQSNYSQYSSRYGKYLQGIVEPCFDPGLSGGALYDINIYNLNEIIELFGAPEDVRYFANTGFNGIDTSGTAVLTYPGFMATATGAKDSDSPSFFIVQGEKGWMRIPDRPSEPRMLEVCIGQEKFVYYPDQYSHRMTEEFIRLEKMFREEDSGRIRHCLQTSLDVMRVAEQARKDAGIHFASDEGNSGCV